MKSPPVPPNERERIDELNHYNILDTLPDSLFDDITQLASQICQTPIALISLIDKNRQWFKSKQGLNVTETPRDISFCGHAILENKIFEIPNALEDDRFFDNPLVTGEPNIRFYAGLPLITRLGFSLGTLCVIDSVPRKLSPEQHSALIALGRQVMMLIESRLAFQDASRTSLLLERTGEMAKIGGWQLDITNMKLEWTKEVFSIHELTPGNLPTISEAINFYAPEARPLIKGAIERAIAEGTVWDLELPLITARGRSIWVRAQGAAIMENGKVIRLLGAFQDITEQKITQLDLAWLNRALLMLSKCNETLIHVTDETKLIIEISRIAVEVGGYRMAWVGYANDDDEKSVSARAHFGKADNFLNELKLSWSAETPAGRGPGGRTIREGKPVFVEDMLVDPTYPLKELVAKQGYRGLASLPLKNKGKTFGLLALYSSEVRSFADDEIRLLQELSDNLAAGIINIRAEKERQRLHSSLLAVATVASLHSSETFFPEILNNLINATGAHAGYIGQFLTQKPWSAKTIAVQVDNELLSNFEFLIPNAISDTLFASSEVRIVNEFADRDYPQLAMMRFYKYQAFAALRLIDSNNNPVGLLFVLFKKAIAKDSIELITSLLKIFAARTASELERLKAATLISEQASLLDQTRDAIVVRDMDRRVTYWNKAAEALYGWSAAEAIGNNIQKLLKHPSAAFRSAEKNLLKNEEWSGEMIQQHRNGSLLAIEDRWTLVRDNDGKPKSVFSINSNISNRKTTEFEIRQLAFYDPLTNLANRRLLIESLEKALKLTRRKKNIGAILFIDLDNFKVLNDTLGHDKGDLLLKEVANRLKSCVRDCDTVSRFGGDEFVILLEGLLEDEVEAIRVVCSIAEKIIDELSQPVGFNGYTHVTTPSIGITFFTSKTKSSSSTLKEADIAMYKSKSAGRNRYSFFKEC